jgi:hypothetical protein
MNTEQVSKVSSARDPDAPIGSAGHIYVREHVSKTELTLSCGAVDHKTSDQWTLRSLRFLRFQFLLVCVCTIYLYKAKITVK